MQAWIGVLVLSVATTIWAFSTLAPPWYVVSAALLVAGVVGLRRNQRSTVDRYGLDRYGSR